MDIKQYFWTLQSRYCLGSKLVIKPNFTSCFKNTFIVHELGKTRDSNINPLRISGYFMYH